MPNVAVSKICWNAHVSLPGGGFLEPSAHFGNGGGPVSGKIWQWRVIPTELRAPFYVTLLEIGITAWSAGDTFQESHSQLHFALRVLRPMCIKFAHSKRTF